MANPFAPPRTVPIVVHRNDLPDDLHLGSVVAIDTETMGLVLGRDRLCVAQLFDGSGSAHLVHFVDRTFDAPNLKRVLTDPNRLKLFHFARFDVAIFLHYLGIETSPVFCTKIASKLVRTFTDRHGLKELVREFCNVDMSKQQQSSDWGAPTLTQEQQAYAASDVLYLHDIYAVLQTRLQREELLTLAESCFRFIPTRARLDLKGWCDTTDIFNHS